METVADQGRDVSGVVQVGMGEDNGVDVRGGDLERYPVTVAEVLIALEQPALARTRWPRERIRYLEPVTVSVAPRNWSVGGCCPPGWGTARYPRVMGSFFGSAGWACSGSGVRTSRTPLV